MNAVALALAFFGAGSYGSLHSAPPPQYFLTGYAQQRAAEPMTILGNVQQPESRMFRIARDDR